MTNYARIRHVSGGMLTLEDPSMAARFKKYLEREIERMESK